MAISRYIETSNLARPGVCTSTTRPASPYEGQTVYLTDTDLLQIWTGSAWRTLAFGTASNGTVLQVVNSTTSTTATNSTVNLADTGLTASITPTSSTSKILVMASINGGKVAAINTGIYLRLLRDSTTVSNFSIYHGYTTTSTDTNFSLGSISKLDSPASTSSLTYKVQFSRVGGSGTVEVQNNNAESSITLMEIAA